MVIKNNYKSLIAVFVLFNGIAIWYYFNSNDMFNSKHSLKDITRPPPSTIANYFQTENGLWLYYKSWPLNEGTPKGLIFIIHGLGEHISLPGYEFLANRFNEQGFIVFGHDHEGHGKSSGTPAHVESFDDYCNNAFQFIQEKSKDYQGLPVYIFGHSMGGIITLKFALAYQDLLSGIMVTGPALLPPVPGFSRGIQFLGRLIPKLGVSKLDLSTLSRNHDAFVAYTEDPLVYHGKIRVGWAAAFDKSVTEVHSRANEIKLPVIILHGVADRITSIEGSDQIIGNIGSEDKQLIRLEDICHEIFEDPDRDNIVKLITDWLNVRFENLTRMRKIDNVHQEEDLDT